MIKLKLKNALSYSGIIRANQKSPYVEVKTKKEAEEIVDTGYFEIVQEEKKENTKNEER